MTYFAIYDDDGTLVSVGETDELTGDAKQWEISKDEYDRLMDMIQRTWEATEKVLAGELAIEDVDEDIREQVRRNAVNEFAERVYRGEMVLTGVPEDMQADVQAAVDALIAERGEYVPEMSEADAAIQEALTLMGLEVA